MMSSVSKILRERNVTYLPFEMNMEKADLQKKLRDNIGYEHSSE